MKFPTESDPTVPAPPLIPFGSLWRALHCVLLTRRVILEIWVVDVRSKVRWSTNHHLGSNSSLSLTPFFFSMHIKYLRNLPAVR